MKEGSTTLEIPALGLVPCTPPRILNKRLCVNTVGKALLLAVASRCVSGTLIEVFPLASANGIWIVLFSVVDVAI